MAKDMLHIPFSTQRICKYSLLMSILFLLSKTLHLPTVVVGAFIAVFVSIIIIAVHRDESVGLPRKLIYDALFLIIAGVIFAELLAPATIASICPNFSRVGLIIVCTTTLLWLCTLGVSLKQNKKDNPTDAKMQVEEATHILLLYVVVLLNLS